MSQLADEDERAEESGARGPTRRDSQSVGASARREGPGALAIAAIVIGVVVAIALWRVGSGLGQQACIAKTLGEYPAVSVSAYDNPREVGALKLSYDNERRQALKKC